MTKTKRDNAIAKLNAKGIEAEAYDGYSGRGMFGEETFALTVSSPYATVARELVRGARIDSLGLDFVIY